MNTLLIINSSPRGNSVSRRLTRHVADDWRRNKPEARIIERDLASEALPFLSDSWIQAANTPAAQRTADQRQVLALSDTLIDELMVADVIVLGVPMHNFSIPAALKAWFDLVARAGKTFSYTDKGPKGLIPSGKKVLAMVARGGVYQEGAPADFQVPYLRLMLGFIGLTDITVVDVDRQAFGEEAAQQSIDRAIEHIAAVTESCAAQAAA
jgi:FMN-dependent NADH-azoreductase